MAFWTRLWNGDAVVLVNVISFGGVIPFDVCELAKIGDILVSETAVDVCVLWFVGCVKLVSVPIKPVFQLWRRAPGPVGSMQGRDVGIVGL